MQASRVRTGVWRVACGVWRVVCRWELITVTSFDSSVVAYARVYI